MSVQRFRYISALKCVLDEEIFKLHLNEPAVA